MLVGGLVCLNLFTLKLLWENKVVRLMSRNRPNALSRVVISGTEVRHLRHLTSS
eukprot:m.311326 g.311326  ORF g.311326 m.311326 type:complete len:54 (+) comp65369_c0_seq1:318-479(+)